MLEIAGVFFTAAVALVSESCPRLSACRGAVMPRHLFDGDTVPPPCATRTGPDVSPSEPAQPIATTVCKMAWWPSLLRSGVAGAFPPNSGAGVKARAILWTAPIFRLHFRFLPMKWTMTNGA